MQESVPLSMPLLPCVPGRPLAAPAALVAGALVSGRHGLVVGGFGAGGKRRAPSWTGMVLSVAPSYSARVLEVSVRPGQEVRQGALLARFDAADYNRRLGQAAREADDLRRMAGPPGREETAARLRDAEAAEKDMVRRLAQARHEGICDSDSGRKAWLPTCAPSSICADWTVRAARVWWGRTSMPQPGGPKPKPATPWTGPLPLLKKSAVFARPWTRNWGGCAANFCAIRN